MAYKSIKDIPEVNPDGLEVIRPQVDDEDTTRARTQKWISDIRANNGIINRGLADEIKKSIATNFGLDENETIQNFSQWVSDLGFDVEHDPNEQDDYDLINSFIAPGGHGPNWKGYKEEWDNIRNAGFDIPEKRNGYNFAFDPHTITVSIFKFDKYGNPHLIPIKRRPQ